MTPLTPVYIVCVQCFTRRSNQIFELADDVFFHEAWFVMLHYIQPVHLWFPDPNCPEDILESFPVLRNHFIITDYGITDHGLQSIYSFPISDWGELHSWGAPSP